jgi:integrase
VETLLVDNHFNNRYAVFIEKDNPTRGAIRVVATLSLFGFQARNTDVMANSTQKKPRKKPAKPYPTFPLTDHPSGRWCKKIRGKLHYFGRWATQINGVLTTVDNPAEAAEAALNEYLEVKDQLHAGRTPRPKSDGVSVASVCNPFLEGKENRVESGELSAESFRDYYDVCKLIAKFFGRNRLVEDLTATDFAKFRSWLSKRHGIHRLAKDVRVTRMVFKFAYDSELIDNPVRLGSDFKEPNKKTKRRAARETGKKYFDAAELLSILKSSTPPMRAMILLGINCGFGQTDVANLTHSAIDLEGGWVCFPRPKTEIDRRCPLWPETIDALREAAGHRGKPKDDTDTDCVFITRIGNRFVRMTPNDNPAKRARVDSVSRGFRRLLDSLGIVGRRGFYALRHTFETIGGESRDQVAVDAIMGHVDPSMAANYRHRISDERLRAVVETVREWLWPADDSGDQVQ